MAAKIVLFFLAGQVATAAEKDQIAALTARGDLSVGVRAGGGMIAGTKPADQRFGSALEACDYVAGTVPTAYNAKTVIKPVVFAVFPAAISLDASNVDLQQLVAASLVDGVAANLAADAAVVWSVVGGTTDVVTVDGDGKLTAVAAGSRTVRATYTYAAGRTVTADCAVTVVA